MSMPKRTKRQKAFLVSSFEMKALKMYTEGLITLKDYEAVRVIRKKADRNLK